MLALSPIRTKLEFRFALLTAAGGLVLAAGQGTDEIAVIAVFSAAFGFVFVDWLRLFYLPPAGAYLGMAGAAAYCVHDFWTLQQRNEPQMASVAMLLVLVQGVLMLQRKSRRILEQLAVFCLLELVVAAIFSDAINFGLMLLPISLVGASAMSMMGLVMTLEGIDVILDRPPKSPHRSRVARAIRFISGLPNEEEPRHPVVTNASPDSAISIYSSAGRWTRVAVLSLSPAVLLIAAAFFYVIPRRIDPSRSAVGGPALVGFDDKVRLEQLGQVMQNPKVALKVRLTDDRTDNPYLLNDSLYLRGKVLESYEVDYSGTRPVAQWVAVDGKGMSSRSKLPRPYQPRTPEERMRYDSVKVDVVCEAMNRPALFSIAPYYRSERRGELDHSIGRWTLSRRIPEPPFPRTKYSFLTHAFFSGVQSRWIASDAGSESALLPPGFNFRALLRGESPRPMSRYQRSLLSINTRQLPTVVEMTSQLVESIPQKDRTPERIARQLEQFLANDSQFQYTLKLDSKPIEGMDPVEQFLSIDKRGHCQFFASALALMLRSVNIPCRVVVGYRTREYNEIGEYYLARQEHAHAWVEALIDADTISPELLPAGQRRSKRYWMRLDPTPGLSEVDDGNRRGVKGLINMANNLWEDYVIEMDQERQSDDLAQATGLTEVQSSYKGFFERMKSEVQELRARELRGGEFSLGRDRSLGWIVAAILGGSAFLLLLMKVRLPAKFRRWPRKLSTDLNPGVPAVAFYAETLRQLERIGFVRRRDETPRELLDRVGESWDSLKVLTEAFERCRYGAAGRGGGEEADSERTLAPALEELTKTVDQRLLIP